MHPSQLPIDQLLQGCNVERTRRGGPGGQHRNKVETAIVVTHVESGVTGQASERRSQHANKESAIERLRANLAVELRAPWPENRQASELWKSRARGRKVSINPTHSDFPALLAEAMDCIFCHHFEIGNAADFLGVSTSQLIKLLKLYRPAFERINLERQKIGLGRLK